MTWSCEWSLELPVIVNDMIVSYCPDVDCIMVVDESGDLHKVGFSKHGSSTWVRSGPIFDIAREEYARERDRIMELCEVPSDVRFPIEYSQSEYIPVYGVTNGRGRIIA